MAGKMVPAVFGNVKGLEIIPSILFLEITGSFYVHEPESAGVEENLKMLKEKLAETKPDLAVCFDGDADPRVHLSG